MMYKYKTARQAKVKIVIKTWAQTNKIKLLRRWYNIHSCSFTPSKSAYFFVEGSGKTQRGVAFSDLKTVFI